MKPHISALKKNTEKAKETTPQCMQKLLTFGYYSQHIRDLMVYHKLYVQSTES